MRTGFWLIGLLAAASSMLFGRPGAAAPAAGERFLFSYFTGNGEDGLHLAASADGLTWRAVGAGRSLLAPSVGGRLMRDPCVLRGPDGTFHMVWTTGWWDRGIGVAHSKDLRTWSAQAFVPVMEHETTALNAWAPEIAWDAEGARFVIVWASTIPGRFPETDAFGDEGKGGALNHRLYYTTTTDFREYAPTKLLYDPGFSAIDATIVKDGDGYVMILKDETKKPVAKKHLKVARAPRIEGPWGPASAPISTDLVEGPTLLRVGEDWLLYYDEYTRHRYGVMRSRDLSTWTVVTDQLRLPDGVRHGTAFEVEEAVIKALGS
jgi:beta-xylosidase